MQNNDQQDLQDLAMLDPIALGSAANAQPLQATPNLQALIAQEPDLVDRIFDYLVGCVPEMRSVDLSGHKAAVRDEFAGAREFIRSNRSQRSKDLADEVLRKFNGRNATEVARELGITRPSVYRILKRAGK